MEHRLDLMDIPIVNFLEQVAADFELEAQKRKMAIEVLPNNRDVVLELDAEKMVRVINNLLSNAIKYGHEDSVITMEVLRNDGVVTIAVRNAGDPISKKCWNNSLHVSTAQKHPVRKKQAEPDLVLRLPRTL